MIQKLFLNTSKTQYTDLEYCFINFPLQQNRRMQNKQLSHSLGKETDYQKKKDDEMKKLMIQLDYISPRKHRFFCKYYKLETSINEIPLLLADLEDYHLLINNESKKITTFLRYFQLQQILNILITTILQYFEEFTKRNVNMLRKIVKKHMSCDQNKEKESNSDRCIQCKKIISEYRVQQIKEQLKLNKFEDHCNYFNIDHLNFSDMRQMRNETKNIIQSQLNGAENPYQYKGDCISLEQYEEVLNLLGSDLYQKNNSIEKIIDFLHKADKNLSNDNFKQSQTQAEMVKMDSIVEGNGIKARLAEIVRHFFQKYQRMKAKKRKDVEMQVNIDESSIIKQLENEKKTLKNRVYNLVIEREKLSKEYQKRINVLQDQIEANNLQYKLKLEDLNLQCSQQAQKYAQEFHLHQIHKKQLDDITNSYTSLLVQVTRKNLNDKEERLSTHHKKNGSRSNTSLSKQKGKVKQSFRKQANHIDANIKKEVELESKGYKKGQKKQLADYFPHHSEAIQGMALQDTNGGDNQQRQYGIEAIQEEQGDNISSKSGKKRKTSRFKALMSHFSSNANIQQLDPSISKHQQIASVASKNHLASKTKLQHMASNTSTTSLLHGIKKETRKKKSNQIVQTQAKVSLIKQSSKLESRYQILHRLFQKQIFTQQIKLSFQKFYDLYTNFISVCSEQKILNRSTSLNEDNRYSKVKPRVSILNSKLQKTLSRTLSKTVERILDDKTEGSHQRENKILRKNIGSENVRVKLDPLEKKSKYYLKGSMNRFPNHSYKNYHKTAEQTLRNVTQYVTSIREVQLQSIANLSNTYISCRRFTIEDITELYLNLENINKFEREMSKGEEIVMKEGMETLMKMNAELANLHLTKGNDYQQIKGILLHPREVISHQPILAQKQNTPHMSKSLKYILRLHRDCLPKGQCNHLSKFIQKIRAIIDQKAPEEPASNVGWDQGEVRFEAVNNVSFK